MLLISKSLMRKRILIIFCLFGLSCSFLVCKKSKLSPNCASGKMSEAKFWVENNGGDCKVAFLKIDGPILYVNGKNFSKIPKEFRNSALNDTLSVMVNYKTVEEYCTNTTYSRCDCGGVKIKCIQKK